jgi:hypothetical protein
MKKFLLIMFMVLFAYANKAAIDGYFEAVGYSAENQSPYAAFLSAKLDAQRQLLEQIKGTKINSNTTIKNGMLESDTIRSSINGILKGAKVIEKKYDPIRRMAVVKVAVGYKDIVAAVVKDKKILNFLDNVPPPPKSIVLEKNENLCDGLIVDVRSLKFEPAMINRIFTKDYIVYDPTKVPQSVIVERGLASYTVSINKAKAILNSYGSNNVCVIKAQKLKTSTDVIISENDAKKILSSNKKKAFLESAKVVFVLDNN